MPTDAVPRWDLSSVYPGLDSAELAGDEAELRQTLDRIGRCQERELASLGALAPAQQLARALDGAVDLFNRAYLLSWTLAYYVGCLVSTNSYDAAARKKQSELELVQVELKKAWARFQVWLRGAKEALPAALRIDGPAREHAFVLSEAAEQATYLMSEPQEMLAAELAASGTSAWSRLQRTITSQITVDFEVGGEIRRLPMPALINLRTHPDESVRRRAYEREIREWQRLREPLAACLNGVKGAAVTLNRRRGRADCLHAPVDLARIDRPTFEALLAAMRDSLPVFGRYFAAKARRMGKPRLAWWDLFAPGGATGTAFSFARAREFVLENFATFSADLSDFARRAFTDAWIDAEPRDGKEGGGFCTPLPKVKESRVFINFDGSLELVSVLAHELGHAYHNACADRAGKTPLQQLTPMTMAETASIMCETIVNNAILARAKSPAEELAILEHALIGDSQVIVDIYSRFLFEKEVMERRERSELSAEELCDAMERAQAAAYGDALDERFRNGWMWTWKPHYYDPELDFYNFPYSFGLLFGTGLYARYLEGGKAFVADFERLLAGTGEDTAANLAGRFGIDLRDRAFWDGSIGVIRTRVDRYCGLQVTVPRA